MCFFCSVKRKGNNKYDCRPCPTLLVAYIVWRSLTPPSKIGKGSGEPRIIDLCNKQNCSSTNQISKRHSGYFIPVMSLYLCMHPLRIEANEKAAANEVVAAAATGAV